MLNAMFWLARSGATWRELPERYGPWKSVATRFYRWRDSGLFGRMLVALQRTPRGEVDWSLHLVDSPIIRAHQHAAGAKGGGRQNALAARAGASAPSCI
jgi:transposase